MALSSGSKGQAVKDLQKALRSAGFDPGPIDGIFGPKTGQAVRAFKKANGLANNAIAGPNTLQALDLDPGTTGPKPKDTYTGDEDNRFHGLGGRPEVWKNSDTDEVFVVYFVPGFEPPVPMVWRVDSKEDLKAYFGKGQKIIYDRVLTGDEFGSTGPIAMGVNTELRVTEGDPFEGWVDRWERERKTRPYLDDPEVAALIIGSAMEGNTPSEAELQGTAWWQKSNEGERQWLILTAADPETARQRIDSNRLSVRQLLGRAGVFEPPEELVNLLADNWTTGLWDEAMLNNQVNTVADPFFDGVLDAEVQQLLDGGVTVDLNQDREDWVRTQLRKWLGPVFGQMADEEVNAVAGRLRNDPNAEEDWIGGLKSQRVAMFPNYTDLDASYNEIAQPWRGLWNQILGETANEETDTFQQIVQNNDLTGARSALVRQGLDSRNQKVSAEMLGSFGRLTGFGVRDVR